MNIHRGHLNWVSKVKSESAQRMMGKEFQIGAWMWEEAGCGEGGGDLMKKGHQVSLRTFHNMVMHGSCEELDLFNSVCSLCHGLERVGLHLRGWY
jgi:hypothetical protein